MTATGGLPPHLQRVADAVEAPLGRPLAGAVIDAAVRRLADGLSTQASRLPDGSTVVVDGFAQTRARLCPASRAPDGADGGFTWTPRTSARWLGLKALESWVAGDQPDLAAAVAAACSPTSGRPDEQVWSGSPQVWLAEAASGPDRAATVAAVTAWAEQAAQWVPWHRWRDRRLRFEPERRAWPAKAAAAVKGRWEADLRPDPSSRSRVQVLLLGAHPAAPAATAAVGLAALRGWLAEPREGRGPARVVAVHPATGDVVSTAIDAALLGTAVEDALAAAAVLVDAALALPLAATPGPQCRWCGHRSTCAPGAAWLERPDRRIAGLPVRAAA